MNKGAHLNNSLKTGKHISSVFSISENLFIVSKLLSTVTQNQFDFFFFFTLMARLIILCLNFLINTLIYSRRSLMVAIAQEYRIMLPSASMYNGKCSIVLRLFNKLK